MPVRVTWSSRVHEVEDGEQRPRFGFALDDVSCLYAADAAPAVGQAPTLTIS
jgi:hypothetical protein